MISDRESRKERYQSLCEKVGSYTFSAPNAGSLSSIFKLCPECKEINLWTYWHGWECLDDQDDSVHPKILLVGQDWGNCDSKSGDPIGVRLTKLGDDPAKYTKIFSSHNYGPVTDENLKKLFADPEGFNYDLDQKQPNLFFVNLIPWYRQGGIKISGFKRSWLTCFVKEIFKDLVKILEPEIIMCLGKNTYRGVLDSLGLDKGNLMKQSYNSFLDSKSNYANYQIEGGSNCKVWALAHCGGLGVRNRSFEKQLQDWREIHNSVCYSCGDGREKL